MLNLVQQILIDVVCIDLDLIELDLNAAIRRIYNTRTKFSNRGLDPRSCWNAWYLPYILGHLLASETAVTMKRTGYQRKSNPETRIGSKLGLKWFKQRNKRDNI